MRSGTVARNLTGFSLVLTLVLTLGPPPCASAAPGDLDSSFGSGGEVRTDFGGTDVATGVALQSDGKIVVAGRTTVGGNSNFALGRYTLTGSLDPTFGRGGLVITDFGGTDQAFALVVQPDGRIVAAGRTGSNVGLARYNQDGDPDFSFGNNGRVSTNLGATEQASAVALQADGKIVVAGRTTANGNFDFLIGRYTIGGLLDSSFGTGGTVIMDFSGGSVDRAFALTIQPDGKIVVAGDSDANFALARYNPDGTLDASFGNGGKVITTFGGADAASAVALQPDGKIVVAGQSDNGTSIDFALARYNPDGSLDTSFGSGGKVATNFTGGSDDAASAVAIQFDGKIVVAGDSEGAFAVARYNPDGTLDTTFGTGGKVTTDLGGEDVIHALALQPDGQIVVVGESAGDFALVRYQGFFPLSLRLNLNKGAFVPGDTFQADLIEVNPGPQRLGDIYLGILLPPGAGPAFNCPGLDAVVFFGGGFSVALTCLSASPQTFVPLAQNASIPGALPTTVMTNFLSFVWPPNAPAGTYVIFVAFTRPGTLDIIVVAVVSASFTP